MYIQMCTDLQDVVKLLLQVKSISTWWKVVSFWTDLQRTVMLRILPRTPTAPNTGIRTSSRMYVAMATSSSSTSQPSSKHSSLWKVSLVRKKSLIFVDKIPWESSLSLDLGYDIDHEFVWTLDQVLLFTSDAFFRS